jgi:hypothetical protein
MDEVTELSRTGLEARLSALLAEEHDEDGAVATEYEALASIKSFALRATPTGPPEPDTQRTRTSRP